jgi:peroxiredoxin
VDADTLSQQKDAEMKPEAGDRAPDFVLPDAEGRKHSLRDLLAGHKALVLYFYPKDDTPGWHNRGLRVQGLAAQAEGAWG